MTDTLLLEERVKNTIQLGESHFREFKSAIEGTEGNKNPRPTKKICMDIAEALVAFSNADGGELLIGVEDDGVISGIPHNETEINRMLAATRTHVYATSVLPLTAAAKIILENKVVLFFSVTKGITEIYQLADGRCVRRKDKSTVPETPNRIMFDRQEIRSREYDRQFVDGATVNDLDVNRIQAMADSYLRGLSVEWYLQQIGVAEYATNGLRLRMAALLLFAKDIQRWHPRCQVRFLEVVGTELKTGDNYNVKRDESVQDNIFELLRKSWERLLSYLTYKTEFGADAKFEQKYIYPEHACFEALVNAIAHRDYSIQNGIDIFIFDDRMEIKSPGALLSTLTIKDLEELQGAHESRNALITKVLRENKFMRELGEGMKRIFQLMEENELEKPKLESTPTLFGVTLTHKSVFNTQQEQWLSLFKQFNLTPLQKKIVVVGMANRELSPDDIFKAMNTDDSDTYNKEVGFLRGSRILIEVRTYSTAITYAKKQNIHKRYVPRYKVQIPVDKGIKQLQDDPDKCVFIANLPQKMTRQGIKELFASCGTVERIYLPLDGSSFQAKGFGFVWFDKSESAQKAIDQLNGYKVDGRVIVVKKHVPKDRNNLEPSKI